MEEEEEYNNESYLQPSYRQEFWTEQGQRYWTPG